MQILRVPASSTDLIYSSNWPRGIKLNSDVIKCKQMAVRLGALGLYICLFIKVVL